MVNLPSLKNLSSIKFTYVGNNHIVYFENGVFQTLTDNLVYHIDSFERDGTGEHLYYDQKTDIIVRADNDTFPLGVLNLGELEIGDFDEEINESNFYENYQVEKIPFTTETETVVVVARLDEKPFVPGIETVTTTAHHEQMKQFIYANFERLRNKGKNGTCPI